MKFDSIRLALAAVVASACVPSQGRNESETAATPTVTAEVSANSTDADFAPGSESPEPASSSAASPLAEAKVGLEAVNLIPGRVRNHYPTQSSGNDVTLARTAKGDWNLRFSAVAPRAGEESWAGYCWDLNFVNGTKFSELEVAFELASDAQEMQFKLERENNKFQDKALRFPSTEGVRIPLDNYPVVRPEVARFCLVLAAPGGSKGAVNASVTMSEVWLR